MKLKIDYVEFQTPEIADSKAFFAKAFGWPFTDYGPDYASFERSSAGIDGGFGKQEGGEPQPVLIILKTDDLAAAEAEVVAAGGEIVTPAFDFPGGRRFHFREPGGNILGVWSEK